MNMEEFLLGLIKFARIFLKKQKKILSDKCQGKMNPYLIRFLNTGIVHVKSFLDHIIIHNIH